MRRATYSLTGVVCAAIANVASGQELTLQADDTAIIHCPDEVDLQVMVDFCGRTLGLRFLYGEELQNQRVQLRPSPIELPRKHLLPLLISLLRVRDLTLVEVSEGFYRIVRAEQSTRHVSAILPDGAALDGQSLRLITQALPVASGKAEQLTDQLGRYMSSPKGGIIAVPESNLIIVTDYESRIVLLRELLSLLDVARPGIEVATVPVPNADPMALASQVATMMAESHRLREQTGQPPSVRGDILPGSIVVMGSAEQIERASRLIEQLTPESAELTTKPYRLRFVSVDRAKKLVENVVLAPGSGLAPPRSIYVDKPGGRLFVTAEPETQAAIAALLALEDTAIPETQRPLRIYRPDHRSATELLTTLVQLLGDGTQLFSATTGPLEEDPTTSARSEVPPTPPQPERALRLQGSDYVLSVDEHTNAIMAIGTREFHAQLESLIDELDRRRPQVLIEVTLVAITSSDSLDFGVELEALDLGDAWDFLLFSNFGLSSIDVVTGQRVLEPGLGANGVLLGPDKVPIVIKALATRGLAKVLSTAKLLVSDNARGTLRNVDEAPFTSVNASDTVATTSFAGFESAGTTLSVTPHITEGDHLTLEYELTFSNFTGSAGSAGVPPPRTTNSFTSTVEVPDGYTVVTGGLVVDNSSDSVSQLPWVGDIPGLGVLFQSRTSQNTQTKVFAFVRPVILRDDKFEDLKFITLRDQETADTAQEHELIGEPLWMR